MEAVFLSVTEYVLQHGHKYNIHRWTPASYCNQIVSNFELLHVDDPNQFLEAILVPILNASTIVIGLYRVLILWYSPGLQTKISRSPSSFFFS